MIVLSGGPLGGTEIADELWANGEEKNIDGWIYRREGYAGIFCGAA